MSYTLLSSLDHQLQQTGKDMRARYCSTDGNFQAVQDGVPQMARRRSDVDKGVRRGEAEETGSVYEQWVPVSVRAGAI